MNIKGLNERGDISNHYKLEKIYSEFEELLNELKNKELKLSVVTFINECVDSINASTHNGTLLTKLILQKQAAILKQVEHEHKMVPKKRYRNIWILRGIGGIGLPIGVAFGLSIGNIGLLGLGLPIGMAIGHAIGMSLDKKALKDGRQLNIEIRNFVG